MSRLSPAVSGTRLGPGPWHSVWMGTQEQAREAGRPGDAPMLSAFAAHLQAQRGLSEHTVRGYRGDVVSLLTTLAPTGSDPEATDRSAETRTGSSVPTTTRNV